MRTNCAYYAPKAGDITRAWHVIDATDVVLGRLAVQTANLLRGKNKPTYAPTSTVVTSSSSSTPTRSLPDQRQGRHQEELPAPGHPGGLTVRTTAELLASAPRARRGESRQGMLPKNKLSDAIASKLKVYAGLNHPHAAQRPVPFEIKQVAQ